MNDFEKLKQKFDATNDMEVLETKDKT